MYQKTCPVCGNKSYSASEKKWICPYCGSDISKQPSQPTNTKRNIKEVKH